MKYQTFETERLFLRPTNEEDAALTHRLYNTQEFLQFVGDRNLHTEEDALEYLRNRAFPQIEQRGYGNYTVILKDGGEKVGSCGLYHREGVTGVDIGFAYLPEFYGRGYGYEAAKAILDAGFIDFGLEEISALTVQENISSRKLIEKLGLSFRKKVFIPNDPEELLFYLITKKEWLSSTQNILAKLPTATAAIARI